MAKKTTTKKPAAKKAPKTKAPKAPKVKAEKTTKAAPPETAAPKTKAPKAQTIFDAMLNGHAWHFGTYKETKQGRELIPANLDTLKEKAAAYWKENGSVDPISDELIEIDLDNTEILCRVLVAIRKAAR